MFYQTKQEHTFPQKILNSIVIPRPIGWISTISSDGIPNLAPYSFFNAVSYTPPQVMFSSTSNHTFGGLKDSVTNAQTTGEFVINIATYELRKQMNASSVPAPHEIDEFQYVGLTKTKSKIVNCPSVGESPIHLECEYTKSVSLLTDNKDEPNIVVFGKVVGINIEDQFIVDGNIDYIKIRPLGRLGRQDFVDVNNSFSMERPDWNQKT